MLRFTLATLALLPAVVLGQVGTWGVSDQSS
jgi:hypothetical protein